MNPPDFEKKLEETLEAWKRRYRIRDDDVILVCLELFRVHQDHWDQMRKQDFPPFEEFRGTILKLGETAMQIQQQSQPLVEELRAHREGRQFAPPTVASITFAVALAFGLGLVVGKLLL